MDTVKPAIKAMTQLAEEVMTATDAAKRSTNIPEICKLFRQVKDAASILEDLLKVVKGHKDILAQEVLPDLIESTNFDSVKVGGYNYIPSSEVYFSFKKEDEQKVFDWLIQSGYDAIVKEAVNAQALNSALRAYVEDKGEYPPKEFISHYIKKNISVRKA